MQYLCRYRGDSDAGLTLVEAVFSMMVAKEKVIMVAMETPELVLVSDGRGHHFTSSSEWYHMKSKRHGDVESKFSQVAFSDIDLPPLGAPFNNRD